jgi:hypothetical protein
VALRCFIALTTVSGLIDNDISIPVSQKAFIRNLNPSFYIWTGMINELELVKLSTLVICGTLTIGESFSGRRRFLNHLKRRKSRFLNYRRHFRRLPK